MINTNDRCYYQIAENNDQQIKLNLRKMLSQLKSSFINSLILMCSYCFFIELPEITDTFVESSRISGGTMQTLSIAWGRKWTHVLSFEALSPFTGIPFALTAMCNSFWNIVSITVQSVVYSWSHRCWWRMLETKCVGDKFEMLMTDSGCRWPI